MIFSIESPGWINRGSIIYHRINNDFDNYTDLFCTHLKMDLQKAVYTELSDIYSGLRFQKNYFSYVPVSDKNKYFLKSESHLLFAVHLFEPNERDIIYNCNIHFVWLMVPNFMRINSDISSGASNDNIELNTAYRSTADRHNLLNGCNEQKCLLYS